MAGIDSHKKKKSKKLLVFSFTDIKLSLLNALNVYKNADMIT
jgi:hypothetical protein